MIYFDFRVFKWECKMLGFTIFRYQVIYKTKQQIRTSKLSCPCKLIHVLWPPYENIEIARLDKPMFFLKNHSQLILNNSIIGTADWPFPCITCLLHNNRKTGRGEQLSFEPVIVPTVISYFDCKKLSISKCLVYNQLEFSRKMWKCWGFKHW